MKNVLSVPELEQAVLRHFDVSKDKKKLEDINFNFIENKIEGAELVITAGVEIGCTYSIELSFENFSFTIFEGFVEDVPQMVIDTEKLLRKQELRKHIIEFQKKDTDNRINGAWQYNFDLCTSNIIF